MKRMALETTRSLSLEQQDVKVKLIDKKELLFMSTDPNTLQHKLTNAYLVSAVNLDMVPSNTVYSCCNSSEFGNSETAASNLTRK
jgi:hypothetical protein